MGIKHTAFKVWGLSHQRRYNDWTVWSLIGVSASHFIFIYFSTHQNSKGPHPLFFLPFEHFQLQFIQNTKSQKIRCPTVSSIFFFLLLNSCFQWTQVERERERANKMVNLCIYLMVDPSVWPMKIQILYSTYATSKTVSIMATQVWFWATKEQDKLWWCVYNN